MDLQLCIQDVVHALLLLNNPLTKDEITNKLQEDDITVTREDVEQALQSLERKSFVRQENAGFYPTLDDDLRWGPRLNT